MKNKIIKKEKKKTESKDKKKPTSAVFAAKFRSLSTAKIRNE